MLIEFKDNFCFGDDDRKRAHALLRFLLQDHWIWETVLLDLARSLGISEQDLRQAGAELRCQRRRRKKTVLTQWEWGPPQSLPAHIQDLIE